MYKVSWDRENNSILLDDKTDEKDKIVPPRPVFYEELNLLGFHQYWDYPESDAPLLWSIGRRYFYKGECIAEAKGGNIYESPELTVSYHGSLKAVDVEMMIRKNKESLYVIQNEAMDFVQDVYKKHKGKVDYTAVAFSGGKDSQVVLDIVSRVLAPDEYVVIFTDTGMEIPFTHENVKKTREVYQKSYPELKFYTAKPMKFCV
jgi:phosphoadenosine phosphosulfate reductase